MKQIFKNQRGIALLTELLLAGLVLSAGSAVAVRTYYANRAPKYEDVGTSGHQKKTTPPPAASTAKKTTPPSASDPYPGWESYTLAKERLTIRHPKDWTAHPHTNDGPPYEAGGSLEGVYFELCGNNDSCTDHTYVNVAVVKTADTSEGDLQTVDSFSLDGKTVYLLADPSEEMAAEGTPGYYDSVVVSSCKGPNLCSVAAKTADAKLHVKLYRYEHPTLPTTRTWFPFKLDSAEIATGIKIMKSMHY